MNDKFGESIVQITLCFIFIIFLLCFGTFFIYMLDDTDKEITDEVNFYREMILEKEKNPNFSIKEFCDKQGVNYEIKKEEDYLEVDNVQIELSTLDFKDKELREMVKQCIYLDNNPEAYTSVSSSNSYRKTFYKDIYKIEEKNFDNKIEEKTYYKKGFLIKKA